MKNKVTFKKANLGLKQRNRFFELYSVMEGEHAKTSLAPKGCAMRQKTKAS